MFKIDLHEITINGASLPIWVIGLLIIICLLIWFLHLCVKFFIKPWAQEKFKTIELVGAMSEDLKESIKVSSESVKELSKLKHAVTDMNGVVQGFGVRLALIEEKHDIFEEKTKERLTIIETKLSLKDGKAN